MGPHALGGHSRWVQVLEGDSGWCMGPKADRTESAVRKVVRFPGIVNGRGLWGVRAGGHQVEERPRSSGAGG